MICSSYSIFKGDIKDENGVKRRFLQLFHLLVPQSGGQWRDDLFLAGDDAGKDCRVGVGGG